MYDQPMEARLAVTQKFGAPLSCCTDSRTADGVASCATAYVKTGHNDVSSISGGMVFRGSRPIEKWRSKQHMIPLSAGDAELYARVKATQRVLRRGW